MCFELVNVGALPGYGANVGVGSVRLGKEGIGYVLVRNSDNKCCMTYMDVVGWGVELGEGLCVCVYVDNIE